MSSNIFLSHNYYCFHFSFSEELAFDRALIDFTNLVQIERTEVAWFLLGKDVLPNR